MSGRCKACDKVLNENEIVWSETRQMWENLCRGCLQQVYEAGRFYLDDTRLGVHEYNAVFVPDDTARIGGILSPGCSRAGVDVSKEQ